MADADGISVPPRARSMECKETNRGAVGKGGRLTPVYGARRHFVLFAHIIQ